MSLLSSEMCPADVQNHADSIEKLAADDLSSSLGSVEVEKSQKDEDELQYVESTFGDDLPPSCSSKCDNKLHRALVTQFGNYFHKLSKTEEDLIILICLVFHR